MNTHTNRRRFMQMATLGAAATMAGGPERRCLGAEPAGDAGGKVKFKLGLASYTLRKFDLEQLAIHNHGPGDKLYPVPDTAYKKIKDLDERIGLCNDIGHTMRAGVDPAVSAEKLADRLLDVHIKDVSAADAKGRTVEVGRGVIDVPKFLRTLIRIDYAGVVAFEHEKDPDDPLAGLAESVGYVRGVLAAMA